MLWKMYSLPSVMPGISLRRVCTDVYVPLCGPGAQFTQYLTIYYKVFFQFIVKSTCNSDLHRAKISPRNIVN